MKRRKFIKHLGHSFAIPGLVSSFGFSMPGRNEMQSLLRFAQETDRVLVMIFLQGGNDGLNTVVPLNQLSAMNTVRPHVVLPDESLLPISRTDLAWHPELTGFKSLYDEGRLQIIQNVGYADPNFSHFRSTDIWMSGSDSKEVINSGWSGRYLQDQFPEYPVGFPNEEHPHPLAIEIGNKSSLLFQGSSSPMSMVIRDPNSFYELLDDVGGDVPDTIAGDKLDYVRTVARQSQSYGQVIKEAAENVNDQLDYPSNRLADQLKIVTRLIKGGLQTPLYMVSLGSFDTHAKQVDENDHTKGWHAGKLKDLNESVMAFVKDLEFQGLDDRVIGMTFSEFGRRIVSNASFGTDHGAAAPLFVFGNHVAGGQVLGDDPIVPIESSVEDNLPLQYDFRQIYASVLEQWLGASSSSINNALMDQYSTLPIIGEGVVSGITRNRRNNLALNVFPNPLNSLATLEFMTDRDYLEIKLVDMHGRVVDLIFSGSISAGKHRMKWNTSMIPPGRYIVHIDGQKAKQSRVVIKGN